MKTKAKKNIVIDTNVLYSWVHISENPKLPSTTIEKMSREHTLYIATPTIIESIVKHRNDLATIKTCLSPIIDRKAIPVGIGAMPLANDTILKIYSSSSLGQIKKDVDDIVALKISREADFLRFIFIAIIVGAYHCLWEEGFYKLDDPELDKLFAFSSIALLGGNAQFITDEILTALRKGYAINKEQQIVRDEIINLIAVFLRLWIYNFYSIKNNITSDPSNLDPAKIDDFKKEFASDPYFKELNAADILQNPLQILSKERFRVFFEEYARKFKKELESLSNMTDEILDYLLYKMEKFLQQKGKVNKNDVPDLIILYSLHLPDFMLLTLDKKLIKALETVDRDSYNLIKSLGI